MIDSIEFPSPTTDDQVYIMIGGTCTKYIVDRKDVIVTETKQTFIQSNNGAVHTIYAIGRWPRVRSI